MDALRITGLSHNFGSVQALSDVSLTVPRGSFTALLGVNGAGKTTLFSLVTRLYSNVSGSIEVAGHDLRRQPAQAMARLGVVFQSRALDADLMVAQNLAYHAGLHGIARLAARDRTRQVLALTRRLIAAEGVSALWATHIMDEIQPDDDLVILHKGRVLSQGKASSIAGPSGLTQSFLALTGTAA